MIDSGVVLPSLYKNISSQSICRFGLDLAGGGSFAPGATSSLSGWAADVGGGLKKNGMTIKKHLKKHLSPSRRRALCPFFVQIRM